MPKKLSIFILFIVGLGALIQFLPKTNITGAPPYGESEEEVPSAPYNIAKNWIRPEGPAKVGIQVGHWKSSEFPEELEKLRNNTGASGGGKWEWEVNYEIANLTANFLREKGVEAEVLPATVPPRYWADVFIAIHADGSTDSSKSGYKFAGPWRDLTGKSTDLVTLLEASYEAATNLPKDENITRNMRGYYAFSWWRYEHAIHPMTTGVIAETGFLTNRGDQELLIKNPHISANAIAEAIVQFLDGEGLL